MSDAISILNPETREPEIPAGQPERPPLKPKAWYTNRIVKIMFLAATIVAAAGLTVFVCYYVKFARLTEQRLRAGVFAGTLNIFAGPRVISVGDRLSLNDALAYLRENGYSESRSNPVGSFGVQPNAVAIFPGRESYSDQEPAVIHFSAAASDNKVARIVSLADNTDRQEYQFPRQLLTNQSDRNREKRRLVRFSEIPPALVHAVVSVEDKHFFSHGGFDLFRILRAAFVDLKAGRKEQGASTLSMQLARILWLAPDKNWKRKAEELLITMHLEHKLTKQQIFEYYANQVYLGRLGTFSINGFGEAARAYFGKDISQLNLSEAAMLAGMVQRPSYYNPFRYPDRVQERRNRVLHLMVENRFLTDREYRGAVDTPVQVQTGDTEALNSQYFLDLVNDELQNRLGEHDPQRDYVYTTLDMDLQRAAVEAVRIGMQNVDEQLRRRKNPDPIPAGQPQVALIALDPHSGEIKALVGGRDYGSSQLNHTAAERQPGSAFKPFVYAAALNTAIEGGEQIFTPATTIEDEPTTFQFDNQLYQPGNFKQDFMGTVTLRRALAHSLNVATVKLAQMVGYRAVVDMARRAGLNDNIKPTPAVALGAYEATPLEMADAYTMFADGGNYVKPAMLALVRSPEGQVLYRHSPETRPALDPRVAYLMVNLLEEVLRSGTGAAARSRGFRVPAAGKTGTSHDGWFAGFTSQLLCVVWVGFDDDRQLNLEGAKSALPIWTEFMKRALEYRSYRDAKKFPVPSGIARVNLCSESRQLATPGCSATYPEYFVDGSQPADECQLHSTSQPNSDASEPSADLRGNPAGALTPSTRVPYAALGVAPIYVHPGVSDRSGSFDRMASPSEPSLLPNRVRKFASKRIGTIDNDFGATRAIAIDVRAVN
ncbi:MAG: transglycosylase domain-containing protein [Bryobacteraceae bacterium]